MKEGTRTVLDLMLLLLMLAAGIPALLFVVNVFLYESNYGFDTFDEKSVIATDAQMANLGINEALDEKRMWTDSHFMMLRVVDDGKDSLTNRTIKANGGAVTYPLTEAAMLDKSTAIQESRNQADNLGREAWSNEQYHIYITPDGSIDFRTNRTVIN